ncbi:MAG: hypothetical protein PHE58_02975 [Candidatus Omnitrophica bacterium]|nr:hypothetical protein [Candidatus Omnitrophota bacterium]
MKNLRELARNATMRKISMVRGDERGISLIIVVFAMMLFAGLGWTLLSMQATDFQANVRTMESERALYLAESGSQWAIKQIALNSGFRTDSSHGYAGGYAQHNLPGQGDYQVVVRAPDISESGDTVVVATGYAPRQSGYDAMRQIKIMLTTGSVSRPVLVRKLFNWSGMSMGSLINGDVGVTDAAGDLSDGYEGTGDTTHNEPADLAVPGTGRRDQLTDDSSFPKIDMPYTVSQADSVWAPARASKISNIQVQGGKSIVTFSQNIFTTPLSRFDGQGLRNTTMGSWQNGTWGIIESTLSVNSVRMSGVVSWQVGDNVCLVPKISTVSVYNTWGAFRTYSITFACNYPVTVGNMIKNYSRGSWNYGDWGQITYVSAGSSPTTIRVQFDTSINNPPGWTAGQWVGEVRRISGNNSNTYFYFKGDLLYDLRSSNSTGNKSSFVSEGDTALLGGRRLNLRAHNSNSGQAFPCVGTKNGNIYSNDSNRTFDGLIYSENGDITFNGLSAVSVYGYNVTLSGPTDLEYTTKYVDDSTFFSSVSFYSWQEQ